MKSQNPGDCGVLKRDVSELPELVEVVSTHPTVIGSISTHAHIITVGKRIRKISNKTSLE